MNSAYSVVQEEASLPVNICSDGKQSDMSNGKIIRKKSSGKESRTDISITPQFSAISEHSLVQDLPSFIAGLRISLPAGFLANHFPLPENKKETKTNETCGQPLAMLSTSSDHPTPFWKTSQVLFHVDISETFLETYPKSGMTQGGRLYRLPKQVPVTKGTGCGLWQTPNVPNGGRVNPINMSPTGKMPNGKKRQVGLEHQVKMVSMSLWPTPTKCGNHNRKGASATSGDGLATAVKQWPTPKATLRGDCPSERTRNTPDLSSAVKYPTPTQRDYKSGAGAKKRPGHSPCLTDIPETRGTLNADWVEWLMSWPIGWTSLDPLKELIWLDPGIDPHPAIPRVTTGQKNRTNRLKAIGNGQYPPSNAEAWKILTT